MRVAGNGSVRVDWNESVKSPECLAQEYVFCKWQLLVCVCVCEYRKELVKTSLI